jgi:hypothetical protein
VDLGARVRAVLVAVLIALAAPAPARAEPGDTLGAFPGSGNTSGLATFGSRVGRTLTYAHDFLDKRTWASMTDVGWLARNWARMGYTSRLVLTVPMMPDTGGTLARGAAGDYNARFRALAATLVANGQGSAVLRLGPEFNGDWHLWTIDVRDGGSLYAAYWRQIVTTMRSVPGAHFRFDWCANDGSAWIAAGGQLEAASAWPGDAYVDYVGLDVYDQSWGSWNADPVARWNEYVNQHNGLAWHASFAAAHGKQMTFPEWGLADRADGNGGGDTPYFVEQMYWWIGSHDVAYHLYFESHDPEGEYGVFSGRFPNAARRFVEYFGRPASTTAPAPAAPPAPAVPAGGGGSSAGSSAGRGAARRSVPKAAKLSIERARVLRGSATFDLLAPITRLASGTATITLRAGGRRTRFAAAVDGARGQIKLRRRVAPRQARAGTGIVTIAYAGDADTQPSTVRLRAAPGHADLRAQRPRLEGGRLHTRGTIARSARGVVRLQLEYTAGGTRVVRELRAPIRDGRWRIDTVLPPSVLVQIAQRSGTLHAYTLYTGFLPERIRGEMRSAQVLGAR